MDNGQESLPVQSAPSSTFTQQLPLRVNPKYSLPTPLPPLQSMDQPPLSADVEGNSLGRTTSRRRKVSGRGQDQGNGVPRPVVPEAPRAPSAPYQSSYTNDGSPSNPKTNNMASFAVRARAAPSDLVPASFPRTDLDPIVQNTSQNIRSHRHGSINRPPGAVYSEIRGTERKALSSPRTYPTSPQYSSNPTVPRPSQSTESKSPQTSNTTEPTSSPRTFDAVAPKSDKSTEVLPSSRISNTGTAPRGVRITTSTSARSNARRASTGVTEPRAEWAADRSPLQKLEVKLNDISKEEKRARVEEAEQQLRESKLNGTRHERVDPTIHRGQSRRVSADASIKSRNDQSNQASGANKRLSSLGNQVVPVDSSADIQIKQSGGVSYKPSQKIPQFDRRPYPSATKADPPVSQAVDSCVAQTSRRSVSSPDSRYQSERGVRFQQPRFPSATNPGNDSETKTGLISASSRGSRDPSLRKSNIPQADGETHLTVQRNLGRELVNGESMNSKQALSLQQVPRSKKSELSGGHISLTPDIRAADSVAAQALDSKRDASEYRTTSQTAAGIDAHKKARFGNDKAEEPSTLSGSRLSDILHRRQQSESISDDRLRFKLGRLDEWRQGGTARLTSADFDPSSDIAPSQKAWWEVSKSKRGGDQSLDGRNDESYGPSPASFNPPLYLKCGPLLRYTGLKRDRLQDSRGPDAQPIGEREMWRGSVMIVTIDAESTYNPSPVLHLFPEPIDILPPPPQQADDESGHNLPPEYIDPVAGLPKLSRTGKTVYVKPVEDLEQEVDLSRVEDDGGLFEETRTAAVPTSYGQPNHRSKRNDITLAPPNTRHRLREASTKYQQVNGVRLHAERGVTFWRFNLEVELGEQQARIAYRINNCASVGFWVPARGQSMNIMFHSCNGFSMSVDPAHFSGPDPLWRDVLNNHQTKPFHVMIGGGDQIYNDAVMTQTRLFQEWLTIKNPRHKHEAEFSAEMQEELEVFYLERYSMWFSQGLFGMANSQIPMINIWDDHDIIDGFGSYPDRFMRTPVFCGIGAVAFKYYMLFQHQSVADELTSDEPSWLLGAANGPYINELSRSVFMFLGKHVAFLGLDCRTERTREEILSHESYNLVFDRCRREIIAGETKHLVILLGVPIAYPRLVWLENLLTSKVMDPIKALGRTGILGGFLNKFDGGVEILDDLDDHWTAKSHKYERNWFVEELQDLAAQKSIRITILGGDVHLAAVGQFYSNPKLRIPKDRDHRYMANVISSAIVNTPPPELMGDILNKRNKIHHLDPETDEGMIPMFTHDVDGKPRNNKRLLPRRNWCSIREYHPGTTPPPTPPVSEPESPSEQSLQPPNRLQRTFSLSKNDVKPGNLIRRLSGRGPRPERDYAPSNEFRSSTSGTATPPLRSPADDGYFSSQHGPSAPMTYSNGNPRNPTRHSSAPLPRPGNFHRRPTNLSEKAAAKGGNGENNVQISLEHGLDIVINCEVNQKDPAGITTPYRLLIPALWYEGEGDSNEIGYTKKSWIKRLGSVSVKNRRRSVLAKRQGQGNWGGSYSDDNESLSQSEGDSRDEKHDFPHIPRTTGRDMRNQEHNIQQKHRALTTDIDDEEQGFPQQMQNERRFSKDGRYGSPQGQGGRRRHASQERRPSKLDDMLGMAGPTENGHAGDRIGDGNGRLTRFENDVAPTSNGKLGRMTSGRGYGGIEAYKESRWRGLLRRKE